MNNLKKLLLSIALCVTVLPIFACEKFGDTSTNDTLSSSEESLPLTSEEESSSSESSSEDQNDITAPIKLGEAVQGKKRTFLDHINNNIRLKNGINRFDFTAKVKSNQTTTIGRSQMMIEKENDALTRFYVYDPLSSVDAYSDFQYVYTEQENMKLRLDKNTFDLLSYVEDLESPYEEEGVSSIQAYQQGYVRQYVLSFTEEYALAETEELLQNLPGAILTDCKSTFVISNSSMVEQLSIDLIYSGENITLIAARQITWNVAYTFPDFSQYQTPYTTSAALGELSEAIELSQNELSYTKSIVNEGTQTFSYTQMVDNGNFSAAAQYPTSSPRYYTNGIAYQQKTIDYFEKHLVFEPMDYDSFYQSAFESVRARDVNLLNFDLHLNESHIAFILKYEQAGKTIYDCVLNEDGEDFVGIFSSYIECGRIVYTIENDKITKLSYESLEKGCRLYVTADFSVNSDIFEGVDFSAYKMLVNGSNPITEAQATVRPDHEFNQAFVNYQTGEIFLKGDNKKLYRFDKNHNLLNTYDLQLDYGYDYFGGILGVDSNCVYYSAYYGYNTSSDSKVFSLYLGSGAIYENGYGLSYDYHPVAVVYGRVYYEDSNGIFSKGSVGSTTRNYLKIEGARYVSFEKYDTQNNAFILSGYDYSSNYFLGVYNLSTSTLTKEYDAPHLSDESPYWGGNMCGDGFFDDGVFRWYSSIGKTANEPSYLSVVDGHPDRYYTSDILANWQIVKETDKYLFTTYCIYEKTTGKIIYFPQQATYMLFNGGIHVWAYQIDSSETEKTWYTFYF